MIELVTEMTLGYLFGPGYHKGGREERLCDDGSLGERDAAATLEYGRKDGEPRNSADL